MNEIITVIGSSNTDMAFKSKRLPAPGETILGGEFGMYPGGKANQAVAAASLGGNVPIRLCHAKTQRNTHKDAKKISYSFAPSLLRFLCVKNSLHSPVRLSMH